jgi:LPXTG-motif cell wall-anchored protein
VEGSSTTTVEDPTTTTIGDEVLGSSITAAPSTTVEDEVLAEDLPLTGVNRDHLALLAGGLALIGALILAATRRVEGN